MYLSVAGAHRMVSASVGGDGGVFPFCLGVSQESRDVLAAHMARLSQCSVSEHRVGYMLMVSTG